VKICRIASIELFLVHHIRGQIEATISKGHQITLICSPEQNSKLKEIYPAARVLQIPIARDISLFADIISLWTLTKLFWNERFDIIHSVTPKAGLLTAIASWIVRAPVRIHTFTGQVWQNRQGWRRRLLRSMDRLIVLVNTRCYADSFSQASFLHKEGVDPSSKIAVLGKGSLSGINLAVFNPEKFPFNERNAIRQQLGIPSSSFVINFTGRINVEKGVRELVSAFERLAELRDVHLILVGPMEESASALTADLRQRIRAHPRISQIGYISDPEKIFAISDVMCLPSYREGFGNVVLEAAAMGVPTVASRISGLVDSVEDGQTGLLANVQDVEDLIKKILQLIDDQPFRARLALNGQKRTREYFSEEKVCHLVLDEYLELHRLFNNRLV